jgi:hypothetical protein
MKLLAAPWGARPVPFQATGNITTSGGTTDLML